MTGGVSGGV